MKTTRIQQFILNYKIPFDQLIVIDQNGKNLGLLTKINAIQLADEAKLELLLISSKDPKGPIARILNFDKYYYQKQKQLKKSQKKRNIDVIKEVRFSASIAENDLNLRLNKAIGFLKKNYKVKVTMYLRGRQKYIRNFGLEKFETFMKALEPYSLNDKSWKRRGNLYFAQVLPQKS